MAKEKAAAKDEIYFLSNGKTPLTYSIAHKDTDKRRLLYTDKDGDGETHSLRYARNQASPFLDKQNEFAIVEPIVFGDGKLVIPKENTQLQYFMSIHPDNEANGGSVFYKYDPEEVAKREMAEMDLELEARLAIRDMDFVKLKALASELLHYDVNTVDAAVLRHDMSIYAKEYPEDILEAVDDSDVEMEALARFAFDNSFVTLRKGTDIHYNTEIKTRIRVVPHGNDAILELAKWLKSDAGQEFKELLESKVAE